MASDLLDTKQTLAILGISEQTLKRRRHAGFITPVPRNPAKQWAQNYYRRADVERLARGSGISRDAESSDADFDETENQTDEAEHPTLV